MENVSIYNSIKNIYKNVFLICLVMYLYLMSFNIAVNNGQSHDEVFIPYDAFFALLLRIIARRYKVCNSLAKALRCSQLIRIILSHRENRFFDTPIPNYNFELRGMPGSLGQK